MFGVVVGFVVVVYVVECWCMVVGGWLLVITCLVVGCLLQLVGCSLFVGWLVGWIVGWLVAWLAGCSS